jgi:hypothetical protein
VEYGERTLAMLTRLVLATALVLQIAVGQESQSIPNESVFRMGVGDGLPNEQMNGATLFVLNHDQIALPLLVDAIKGNLNGTAVDEGFLRKATALIVYAANRHAFDAVAELYGMDRDRFAPLVGRLLDHAVNREREYDLAYYAIEQYPAFRELVVRWVTASLELPHSDIVFAQEVLRREKAGIAVSEKGSLLTRLPVAARERIVRAVERLRDYEHQRQEKQ